MIKLFQLIVEFEEGYIDRLFEQKEVAPQARFELANLRSTTTGVTC